MYRLTVETLLGLQLEGDHLRIAPSVPADWESYKIHYRYRDTFYHITIQCSGNGARPGVRVTLDGALVNGDGLVPLVDDRLDHHVEVELG